MNTKIFYSRDEIISISELQKILKTVIDDLWSNKKEKIAISRNNKINSVILSVDEYERIKYLADIAEHLEAYNLINWRKNEKAKISLDQIKLEYGI